MRDLSTSFKDDFGKPAAVSESIRLINCSKFRCWAETCSVKNKIQQTTIAFFKR